MASNYAGSPGNYYSHLILSFLFNGLNSNSSAAFLSQAALRLITDSVLAERDSIDGIEGGVIDDPTNCTFNISSLLCADSQDPIQGNATVCLTAAQVENALRVYEGPTDVRNQAQVYPGFTLGGEIEWMALEESLYLQYAVPILQNLVFKNLSYDYATFNWGSDVDAVDREASPLIDETLPDLTAFKENGGKLIVTQGWADPSNSPFWPLQECDEMLEIFGDELSSFYPIFMIPGGGHCGAAAVGYEQVPATYHVMEALVPWVEQGVAPQSLLTTDPPDGSSRIKTLPPYA